MSPSDLFDFFVENERKLALEEKMKEGEDNVDVPAEPSAKVTINYPLLFSNNFVEQSISIVEKELDTEDKMLQSAKILERMLNLNTFNDIAQDFRYWNDPGDEFRLPQGIIP